MWNRQREAEEAREKLARVEEEEGVEPRDVLETDRNSLAVDGLPADAAE
jgi:hypothetical protein